MMAYLASCCSAAGLHFRSAGMIRAASSLPTSFRVGAGAVYLVGADWQYPDPLLGHGWAHGDFVDRPEPHFSYSIDQVVMGFDAGASGGDMSSPDFGAIADALLDEDRSTECSCVVCQSDCFRIFPCMRD